MEEKQRSQFEKIAVRVSVVSIVWNIALTAFKLAAGIIAKSSAMVSDAIHSASDISGTLIVIIGVKLASKESDDDHQYGHERVECVAALIIAAILLAVGAGIGYSGVKKVLGYNNAELTVPGMLALIAAIVSIVVKEGMYWYTRVAAKKIKSTALMAEAWHHRSDAFSSVGSFAGILGARLGFPILDPIASIAICFFIIKAAYDIFLDAVGKMTDKACDDKTVNEITEVVLVQEGVMGIDQMKTRLFGNRAYVDIDIRADSKLTLGEAHRIAQNVHEAVEKGFPNVKHCMVHVNPVL